MSGAVTRAARRLRPARLLRRGRRALRRAVRAARRAAARPPPAPARGQPAGVGARRPLRRGAAARRARDVAAGHTASDQVETVLYRLAASPGRRALLGMRPREGRADPPAAGRLARRHRGVVRRARPAVARGPDQRLRRLRPQPRPPPARAGAARAPPGGRGERAAHGRAAARRGRRARRRGRRGAGRGRRPAAARGPARAAAGAGAARAGRWRRLPGHARRDPGPRRHRATRRRSCALAEALESLDVGGGLRARLERESAAVGRSSPTPSPRVRSGA